MEVCHERVRGCVMRVVVTSANARTPYNSQISGISFWPLLFLDDDDAAADDDDDDDHNGGCGITWVFRRKDEV